MSAPLSATATAAGSAEPAAGNAASASTLPGHPPASLAFTWLMVGTAAWFVTGFFVDAYAHRHSPELESFFTPWHAILYSGFLVNALVAGVVLWRNHQRGWPWLRAMPAGYAWLPLGVLVFAVGGFGDMLWHLAFGIEADTEALMSPTHLLLGLGSVLISAGPLRAAWLERESLADAPALRWLPPVLGLALALSMLMFFTQFAHPWVDVLAASDAGGGAPSTADLYIMSIEGAGQTRLTYDPALDASSPSISPDGRRLAFMGERDGSGYALYAVPFTEAERVPAEVGEPLVSPPEETQIYHPTWSPDGASLAYVLRGPESSTLWTVAADGTGAAAVADLGGPLWRPRFSPDGASIAFAATVEGNDDIWVAPAAGGEVQRLTTDPAQDGDPTWSPDSARIAFASERGGDWGVWVVDAAGGAPLRLLNTASQAWAPAWSPDGEAILFNGTADGQTDIFVADLSGGEPRNLTRSTVTNDGFHSWAPDGRSFVYRARPLGGGSDSDLLLSLGIASVLLQAALFTGAALLLLGRWPRLPLGALTALVAVPAAFASYLEREWWLIVAALVAGLVAEWLRRSLRPAPTRALAWRAFSFLLPAVLLACYMAALGLQDRVTWSVHAWTGAIVMAGAAGLLVSVLGVGFGGPAGEDGGAEAV